MPQSIQRSGVFVLDPLDALDNGDEIARLLKPVHVLLLNDAWDDAMGSLGLDASFSLENEHVQRVLGELGTKIKAVAQTTRDKVAALVGQQAELGWSPAELAQKILEQGEIDVQYRAIMIARTESAAAFSKGSLLAYTESGQVRGTQWLVADPCPICTALADTIAPLGESFADGIDHPPAHPNCRCALAPVLKE